MVGAMALSPTPPRHFDPSHTGLGAARGSVLLVDDDTDVARVFGRILTKAGYRVEICHEGREAVARFKEGTFDVVVSDVNMPGMSGLDLLRAIRERDLDIPVIIVTGSPDVHSATEAMEHGAFRYLIKPVEMGNLLSVVARALRLHQMARVRREVLEEHGVEGRFKGDRAGLSARLTSALQGLWIAYQPIVSWSGRSLYAYEALARTEEPLLRDPTELFDAAERLKRVHDVGRLIRSKVAETLAGVPPACPFFVNIHPADLQDPTLYSAQSPLSSFASRVVLEITERAALDQISDLVPRMTHLREMGYRIALDDLGAGYAGLASFAQLEPNVVKVDMSIVRDVDRSPTKQRLLEAIVSLCRDLDILLVAEGIETSRERETVVRLGVDLCQGYLFARPGAPFPIPHFDSTDN